MGCRCRVSQPRIQSRGVGLLFVVIVEFTCIDLDVSPDVVIAVFVVLCPPPFRLKLLDSFDLQACVQCPPFWHVRQYPPFFGHLQLSAV